MMGEMGRIGSGEGRIGRGEGRERKKPYAIADRTSRHTAEADLVEDEEFTGRFETGVE